MSTVEATVSKSCRLRIVEMGGARSAMDSSGVFSGGGFVYFSLEDILIVQVADQRCFFSLCEVPLIFRRLQCRILYVLTVKMLDIS